MTKSDNSVHAIIFRLFYKITRWRGMPRHYCVRISFSHFEQTSLPFYIHSFARAIPYTRACRTITYLHQSCYEVYNIDTGPTVFTVCLSTTYTTYQYHLLEQLPSPARTGVSLSADAVVCWLWNASSVRACQRVNRIVCHSVKLTI